MWVETFPHRELVNLAAARAIYIDQREEGWFVAADMGRLHRTLVDGIESHESALGILRRLADEMIRVLAPVVRLEQRLRVCNGSSSAAREVARLDSSDPRSNGNGKVIGSRRMVAASTIVEMLNSTSRSAAAIAREAEALTGARAKNVERLIHRLVRGGQTTLRIETADRLAIALGQDAASIWQRDW